MSLKKNEIVYKLVSSTVDIGIFIKKYFNIGKNSALTTVKVVEKYETKTKNLLQGNKVNACHLIGM
jgi:hypothetical protein